MERWLQAALFAFWAALPLSVMAASAVSAHSGLGLPAMGLATTLCWGTALVIGFASAGPSRERDTEEKLTYGQ